MRSPHTTTREATAREKPTYGNKDPVQPKNKFKKNLKNAYVTWVLLQY